MVETFRAVVRLSRDGTFAYLLSGSIRCLAPSPFAENTVENQVEETATHPRLVSSKSTMIDRSVTPHKLTTSVLTHSAGVEHTRGHTPRFSLSDFGLAEPATPPPSSGGDSHPREGENRTYLWLFVLPPVGILLILFGRRMLAPPRPTPTEPPPSAA